MVEIDSQALNENGQDVLRDRVAESFAGKTVLITGGTGFLGKVLLEKILRKCPDIGSIILLIRQKKGKEPKQRLEQLFQGELFELLLKNHGLDYMLSRTRAVTGDVSIPGLGMNEEDRDICRNANVIIHSAASVRFDQCLKDMVFLNTRGTKCMLDLARECRNLELFIHVSTAYCHPDVKVLEERCYPPPADPYEVLKIMETSDNDLIKILTPKLLNNWPNTYVYSKALAESIVSDAMKDLPAIIIRPSVVVPIYKEPLKGWTDNINGPAGLLLAAGKGVLRTMYGNEENCADFVPVDVFSSILMIVTWNCLSNGDMIRVLNCTSTEEIRISWGEMLDIGRKVMKKTPLNNAAWYPGGSMTRFRLYHQMRVILFHWIPAVLVDTLLFCLGIKPVLLRVQRRIFKGMEVFEYYTCNEWEFRSDKLRNVRSKLNGIERNSYKVDAEGFDPEEYFENGTLALRRYILKEKDDTIPAARRHMTYLWCLDVFIKLLFTYLVVSWMYNIVVHVFKNNS